MRKNKIGTVIGDKPTKTIIVQIRNYVRHKLYKKYMRQNIKIYVHDEKDECKVGDRVVIQECRPISKLKRWRVIKRLA